MLGLRAKWEYKVLTTLSLYQQRCSFKKDVKTKKKELPCSLHRPVPAWGPMCPCPHFDLKNVVVYSSLPWYAGLIVDFLMKYYWPREPITTGLYMSVNSPYLRALSYYYAQTGDKYLAIEHTPRGPMLVGVCIAECIIPKMVSDLHNYGERSPCSLEGIRLLFLADCLRKADTFNTYNLGCIYHVHLLATDASIGGLGVGSLLLETAVSNAIIANYPLIQIMATNDHVARICKRLKMTEEKSVPYSVYTDLIERPIFFPRRPHYQATVYTRLCAGKPPKSNEPRLFKTFCDLQARYKLHPPQE